MSTDNYIFPEPTPTSPSDLAAAAFAYMSASIPGWEPNDGNAETWTIYAWAFMASYLMDLAQTVPGRIFRYFGTGLLAQHLSYLTPIEATPAQFTSTWTAIDTAGYTIASGTRVSFQVAGDQFVGFTVDTPVTIPPGQATVTGVPLTAIVPGIAGNGIEAPLVVIDDLAWVSEVTSEGVPAGGADGETDEQYLSRLSDQLQLLAPRPILAPDYAKFALNTPGVGKAFAVNLLWPGRTVTDAATTSTSENLTSLTAAFTADDLGRTVVGAGIPVATTITTITSPTEVKISNNATATATGVTVVFGDRTNAERAVTVAVADLDGNILTSDEKAQVAGDLDAARELNFHVTVIDPTYTTISVTFTAVAQSGRDPDDVSAAMVTALSNYLSPATWGDEDDWPTTVYRLDVAGVLYEVDGVASLTTLTLNGATSDVTLAGVAPLPRIGTVTPLVTPQ